MHMCVCPSGLDGQQQVEDPFQACYLLLNESAAGDRTRSEDGQRASEGVKARGLLLPPVAAERRGVQEAGEGGRRCGTV